MASSPVANNTESTTPKRLGGVTGKGFMPGKSGNPSGRPKGLISQALFRQLRRDKRSDLNGVILGIIGAAKEGNPAAFAHIRDTIDGKPEQTIEHKGEILHTLTAEERASAEDSLSRIVTYEVEDEKILLLPADYVDNTADK